MVTCREDGSSWHHCSSPHFITLFFCCSPLERITWLFLYPFHIHTPSPVSPLFCFFNPPSSFCTHYGLTVSIATLFFFYLTHMAALLTLILRSQYQGAIHSLAWGGDRNVCVFLLWGERGRLEKWCEVQ